MNRGALIARLTLAVPAFGALAGCQDATAPHAPPQSTEATIQAAAVNPASVMFEDVTARILPALADGRFSAELRKWIDDFTTTYGEGDDPAARRAISRAYRLLEAASDELHPANASSIRLTLLQAEALLTDRGSSTQRMK